MEKDMRFEMMKTLKGRQDKFIYYIAGLNVAAIGFTISKTFDITPDRWYDMFLGLALVSWFISISASFVWILVQFRVMEVNMDLSENFKRLSNEHYKKESKKKILEGKDQLEKDVKICDRAVKLTLWLFIVGVAFFIFWRVFDSFQIL